MVRALLSSSLIALVVIGTACHVPLRSHGSVAERGGIMFADDVPLDYFREISLSGPLDSYELMLATHTGDIDIRGVEGGELDLVIELYTEFEGDGTVFLADDRLKLGSETLGKVLISGIRGTIPAETSVTVHSGTGRVVLRDMAAGYDLDIDTGTGSVFLMNCERDRIDLDSGTGALRFDDVTADRVHIRSGTGRFIAEACRLNRVTGDTGTGDFEFIRSHIDEIWVRSGTGNILLTESVVGSMSPSLGTGDVIVLGIDTLD